MIRLNPNSLHGPRSYFTDIDPRIIIHKGELKKFQLDVERRLKIQLLTKSYVVCAASHLSSEFAFNFFQSNPILFEKELVKPALRSDKSNITYCIECKKKSNKDVCEYYKNSVTSVVSWDLLSNAEWFKKMVLGALSDPASILRLNLSQSSKEKLSKIYFDCLDCNILTREIIQSKIEDFPHKDKILFLDCINLLYHLSGARVVNCESSFPQENYIDYSLSDVLQNRVQFSEEKIFIKNIFEYGFELMYGNKLPIEIIDTLSFEDIELIRKPLFESNFQYLYENLLNTCSEQIMNPNIDDSHAIDNLFNYVEACKKVSDLIHEHLQNELDEFIKNTSGERDLAVAKSCMKFYLNSLSMIPIVGTPLQLKESITSGREAFVNISKNMLDRQEKNEHNKFLSERDRELRVFIKNVEINNKFAILDVLNLLKTYSDKKFNF